MKMLLLLLLSLSAFATETQLTGKGQPTKGSFYLSDSRNFLRNPALLGSYNQVSYDVKARDLSYLNGDLVLASGKLETATSSFLAGYKFTDTLAASVYSSVGNGTFFDDTGLKLGLDLDGAEVYVGYDKVKVSDKKSFTMGLVFPYSEYKLFGEYTDVLNSSKYSLLMGLSREFKMSGAISPFADVTYSRATGGSQGLVLTAGMMAEATKDINLMAAVKHDFVFNKGSSLTSGIDLTIIKKLTLGGSISVSSLTKDQLKFEDLNTKLSLTYTL